MRTQYQRAAVCSVVFVLPLMTACHQHWCGGPRDPLCRPWPGYATIHCRTPAPCATPCAPCQQAVPVCAPCQQAVPVCPPCPAPMPVCPPVCPPCPAPVPVC